MSLEVIYLQARSLLPTMLSTIVAMRDYTVYIQYNLALACG